MPRHGSARHARRTRRAPARRIAPAPLRVGLIAIVTIGAVAAAGRGGFWLCVPGVLAAAAVAGGTLGAFLCAAPVLALSLLIAGRHAGGTPPLWEALLVPGLSVAVVNSISRRLGHERDELQHAAFSDPLTGLANRRMLMSMAEYEISRHHRADTRFVVVMLDLDGFKQVNDQYGHAAGDALLRDVADSLSHALRDQDTIARFGGDEFCVIAPETANPRVLADKINAAVSAVSSGGAELRTSIGVSVFPDDGTSIEKLLRIADDRLIAAKRRLHGGPQRRHYGIDRRPQAA